MRRKEWRDATHQAIWFILYVAGMHLFMALAGLLFPDNALSAGKAVAIIACMLITYANLSGIGAFAAERGQHAMEYTLALPISRRQLLRAKFVPRLLYLLLFMGLYWGLLAALGQLPSTRLLAYLSLLLLHLFLVSFCLSLSSTNFVALFFSAWFWFLATLAAVQAAAGTAWFLAAGRLYGESLTGSVWYWLRHVDFDSWASRGGLAPFAPLLAVLPLMPLALRRAFPTFDPRPRSGFNRRLLFHTGALAVPALLLSFILSFGLWARPDTGRRLFLTKELQLIDAGAGEMSIHSLTGTWRQATGPGAEYVPLWQDDRWVYCAVWHWRAAPEGKDLRYMRIDAGDHRQEILYETENRLSFGIHFGKSTGNGKFWITEKVETNGQVRVGENVRDGRLALVEVDLASRRVERFRFHNDRLSGLYMPTVLAGGTEAGKLFWLVGDGGKLVRLWQDNRVEPFFPGIDHGLALFASDRLLVSSDNRLTVYRQTPAGVEKEREFPGDYRWAWRFRRTNGIRIFSERIFLTRHPDTLVQLDLASGVMTEITKMKGVLFNFPGGDTYFATHRVISASSRDWRQQVTLYRVAAGRLEKAGDFPDIGFFDLFPGGAVTNRRDGSHIRCYALPDLKELKFPGLND